MLITKYLGPTNTRGARIKVSTVGVWWLDKKQCTISWNYDISPIDNHDVACKIALAKWAILGPSEKRDMVRVYLGNGYAYGWYHSATDSILSVSSD
jgi:hypothetical protein